MKTYIALLRAINVGGHRKIKMADLRNMFESMGFEEVKTYIQSGNVVFKSTLNDTEKLADSIEKEIEKVFGHDVTVMIRTPDDFEALLKKNPFDGMDEDPYRLYITFFRKRISAEIQLKLTEKSNEFEKFEFMNGELFSLINKKSGQKVMFSNQFVEKSTGFPATIRNRNSVTKILALA